MSLELSVILITVFANLLLGLFTYLKNPKSSTNRLFIFLTIIISFWTFFNYNSLHNLNNPQETLFWIRAVMFVTAPLGPVILLLVHTFPNRTITASKKFLLLTSTITITVAILSFTNLLFSDVAISSQGTITPTPGPAIALYAINFLGSLIAAFAVIIKKYIKSKGREKVQLKYLLLGIIITFSLVALTNFIFVLVLNLSQFVVLGPLFSLILISFISYAIVKHRFMDIGIVVARTVSYSLLVMTFAALYVFVLFVGSAKLFNTSIDTKTLTIATSLAFLMAFTFQPINRFFQRITNKIFHKRGYEMNSLLYEIAVKMSSQSKLDKLSEGIYEFLKENLHTEFAVIALYNEEKKPEFLCPEEKVCKDELDENEISLIRSITNITLYEEIEKQNLKDLFKKLSIAVLIPLKTNKRKIGFLILGGKKSGDIYSTTDITILETIAPQITASIKNAKSAEMELQREKEISDNKTKFLTVAGHKLRTPLSGINWTVDMLLGGDYGKTNDGINKALGEIKDNSAKMVELVNDLFEVQNISDKTYHPDLEITTVPIKTVIQQSLKQLDELVKEMKLKVTIDDSTNRKNKVLADKDKFEKIIYEVVSNAVTYNKVEGSIDIKIYEKDKKVFIEIKDTGIGIKKEELPNIFEKFYRGKDALLKETEGAGIGLFLTQSYIVSWGGDITLNSTFNQGTTVIISLLQSISK